MRHGLLVPVFLLIWVQVELCGFVQCQPPKVVNIAAVFTHNSVIGSSAKTGIEAAIDDINNDQSILKGIRLNLIMRDSNCSVFAGAVQVFQVLEQEVVAIIGPQSSSIARMISFIASGLQVPIVSFAATDPTLSSLQFPYFLRMTQSDLYQMAAIADLIDYYEWKEFISIYVDDDNGRNGMSYLEEKLSEKLKTVYKWPLPVKANSSVISGVLEKTKSFGTRVYVVHVNPDSGLEIFSIAKRLQMMTRDYVWLTTDWLSASLDSSLHMNHSTLNMLQGVVGLRQHVLDFEQKKAILLRKRNMIKEGLVSSCMNNYGFYAYDTVWVVARAIDELLKQNSTITFTFGKAQNSKQGSVLQLGKLKTFDDGPLLLEKLKQINFTGLTGKVQFDSFRNRVNNAYDVINIDQEAVKIIGYWSGHSGFSVIPPEKLNSETKSTSEMDHKLLNASWPGEEIVKPRGWVAATNNRPLRIGIPNRATYVEFVTEDHETHEIRGYCIDVFNALLRFLPYDVPHRFIPFGDGKSNPSYDELVRMVAEDVFDAAIGDITIITNRTRNADFTQPYAANGLVIVIPNRNSNSGAWVFLKPFTADMWGITAAFFIVIGLVIWILEHRINDDFRGPPRRQFITMILFSFSTLFKTNQEDTISTLGRMVMMVWLFLLMVITSSYTASLTSILTIQQLSSPITGMDSLITSNQPIGYQVGSFVGSYLTNSLNIPKSRLVVLKGPDDYAEKLSLGPTHGGVAAVVDELPYVNLFLSEWKDFGIVGEMITKNGWGFVFKKGSPLAIDVSTEILRLSESGDLEKIRDKWFCKDGCEAGRHVSDPYQLHLDSFWGLFFLCGSVTLTALIIFLLKTVRQFVRYKKKQRDLLSQYSSATSSTRCAQAVYSFFNFIDEKEEAIKKIFKQYEDPQSMTV
ncbi:hypothetical protein Sjap_003242 [Stephania japonica]|uniref:Glutamate receptor n=1 Tax=Stephania japonica TaxID=461633 RepID=A0AAP0KQH5_9MAGN